MGKYRIDGPAIVQKGNKVVRYTKAHDEAVNIDDAVAKKLGDKVRPVGDPPAEESKSESKDAAKDSGATASQQASNAAQTSGKGAAK